MELTDATLRTVRGLAEGATRTTWDVDVPEGADPVVYGICFLAGVFMAATTGVDDPARAELRESLLPAGAGGVSAGPVERVAPYVAGLTAGRPFRKEGTAGA